MRIKDYEIIKEIGKGGMGIVYLARDPRLDRLVAIKKIKLASNVPESINTEVVQRFYREARALASLNHTNIVTVHDLGEDKESGDCYMVMEYLEGKNLEQVVKEKGPVSENFICELLLQACDALSYIHQKKMIHRDIKASNIIYDNNSILKLMDFGLVRKQDNSNLTRVGTILGSVSYMSLEQIKDPSNADTQSDLYSLGVTAYYALSGKFPYDGKNVVEIIKNITLEQPLPLSRANYKVDKALEKIIMKSISKNKDLRFFSAIDFKSAIQEYLLNKDKNVDVNFESTKTQIQEKTILLNDEKSSNEIKEVLSISKENESSNKKESEDGEKSNFYSSMRNELLNPTFQEEIITSKPKYSGTVEFKPKPIFRNISDDNKQENIFLENELDFNVYDSNIYYPETIEYLEDDDKSKVLEDLQKINNLIDKESSLILNNISRLNDLEKKINLDLDEITHELKKNITVYNRMINYGQTSTYTDPNEARKKAENTKSHKQSKEEDLKLVVKKKRLFELVYSSKNLRKEASLLIYNEILSPDKPCFFDIDSDIFTLDENKISELKTLIDTKISSFLKLNELFNKLQGLKDKFGKMVLETTSIPFACTIKYSSKAKSAETRIIEDIDNFILIEVDDKNGIESYFDYCTIFRNERPVPRLKKNDDVLMISPIFDENEDLFKDRRLLYSSKQRLIKELIWNQEKNSYKNLIEILSNMIERYELNLHQAFENIIYLFSSIDVDEDTFNQNKKNVPIKINKLKKVLMDFKKEIESSDGEVLKSLSKYIMPIMLATNKFSNLIKEYESGLRNKNEKRKRNFQNIISQINKLPPEILREKKESFESIIASSGEYDSPESMVNFMSFYFLLKAKLPTGVSKNQILDNLNQDKSIFTPIEVDLICRSLNVRYNKEIGFSLKVNS